MKNVILFFVLIFPLYLFSQKISILPTTAQAIIEGTKKNTYTLVYFYATWCHPCIEKLPEFVKAVNVHPSVSLVLVCDPYSRDKIINKVIENSTFRDSVVYKLDATVYKYGINKNIKMFTKEICPACVLENETDFMLSGVYLFNNEAKVVYYNKMGDCLEEFKEVIKKY
jgi:thiol-disulfide isomerase/thioredoxin